MKMFFKFFICMSFLTTSLAWAEHDDDWQGRTCSEQGESEAKYLIDYYTKRIEAMQGYLSRCGNQSNGCIQLVMNRGYGPDTAKRTCEGLGSNEVECLSNVMNRGYGPDTARSACLGVDSVGVDCIQEVMGRGYGPDTASKTCQGLSYSQFSCLKDMMNRGYGPDTARKTCT